MVRNKMVFCLEAIMFTNMTSFAGCNEYLIFRLSEPDIPLSICCNFCLNLHNSGKYIRKSKWAFFGTVHYETIHKF